MYQGLVFEPLLDYPERFFVSRWVISQKWTRSSNLEGEYSGFAGLILGKLMYY